ncbi:hypothetical protein CDO52_05855 [Nocardiopsis gilva YIM 90087]|uniref:Uncharacterized protein n=1 Tax=Nocardiopsis gilva YIM 90087 TaxID=1235441 RepID=A0A223S2M2_9ACTN|nr:hypothetical protein [Nocardiopsis gilva]ASU82375.1 hypothetical protein CDO52_05855 [Nocardiopsis gilva YIM 90087]
MDHLINLAATEDPAACAQPHPDYPGDPFMWRIDAPDALITCGVYDKPPLVYAFSVHSNS